MFFRGFVPFVKMIITIMMMMMQCECECECVYRKKDPMYNVEEKN